MCSFVYQFIKKFIINKKDKEKCDFLLKWSYYESIILTLLGGDVYGYKNSF